MLDPSAANRAPASSASKQTNDRPSSRGNPQSSVPMYSTSGHARLKAVSAVQKFSQRTPSRQAAMTAEALKGPTGPPTLSASQKDLMKAAFEYFDKDASGALSKDELDACFDRSGFRFTPAIISKVMQDYNKDNDCNTMNWEEFVDMASVVLAAQADVARNKLLSHRQYLDPAQAEKFIQQFWHVAGDDAEICEKELADFLKASGMMVAADRFKLLFTEIDADGSGYLDLQEFLTLVIRAKGIKKRKVGPGSGTNLAQLVGEGWTVPELKTLGYHARHFFDAGLGSRDLLPVYTPSEFRRQGISARDLLNVCGWDGNGAAAAGFEVKDLVDAGFSARQIRSGGFTDLGAAAVMRKSGMTAADMKLGGWGTSELKIAGYSSADLRLAGFSVEALRGTEKIVLRMAAQSVLGCSMKIRRRNTFEIREDWKEKRLGSKPQHPNGVQHLSDGPLTVR